MSSSRSDSDEPNIGEINHDELINGELDSGLSNGDYTIELKLEGGSGKASIASPTLLQVKAEGMFVDIVWSSSHYDYMLVEGIKYLPTNSPETSGEGAAFNIPVSSLDDPIKIIADTTAMSTAHEIEYNIYFLIDTLKDEDGNTVLYTSANSNSLLGGNDNKEDNSENTDNADNAYNIESTDNTDNTGNTDNLDKSDHNNNINNKSDESEEILDYTTLMFDSVLPLIYATEFSVSYSPEGFKLLHIEADSDYLLIPEGYGVPDNMPKELRPIKLPIDNAYMVSSSCMDYVARLNSIDSIGFCSLPENEWFVEEVKTALKNKSMIYAGKYSAPDFEQLLSGGCDIAIENTMIYHKPEIKEQLERIGIPVIVEHSSYENNPLGRMEWIKFFGVLFSKEAMADEIYSGELNALSGILDSDKSQATTVAFFYVNSNGAVVIRSKDDYITKMLEMAGGKYLFDKANENNTDGMSTISIQMEEFYKLANNCDVLIYNSTIDAELKSIDDLYKKNELFKSFKAVKEGRVYCTGKNLFQESMSIGRMILDFDSILSKPEVLEDELVFLHKL